MEAMNRELADLQDFIRDTNVEKDISEAIVHDEMKIMEELQRKNEAVDELMGVIVDVYNNLRRFEGQKLLKEVESAVRAKLTSEDHVVPIKFTPINGCDLGELQKHISCCGSSDVLAIVHRRLSEELAEAKVDAVRTFQTEIEYILASYLTSGCKQQFLKEIVDILDTQAQKPGSFFDLFTITLTSKGDDPKILGTAEAIKEMILHTPFSNEFRIRAKELMMNELVFTGISDTVPEKFKDTKTPQAFRDMIMNLSVYPDLLDVVIQNICNIGTDSPLSWPILMMKSDQEFLEQYIEWFGKSNEDNRMVLKTIAESLKTIDESDNAAAEQPLHVDASRPATKRSRDVLEPDVPESSQKTRKTD